ncbi:MAG: hypothetical protein JW889_13420 [Verrucomicrobia bacterium]|nr:hypothetical protein [Verrucomicrobiota bacterium]
MGHTMRTDGHAFPTDDYTPHGYLDNPYHTMRLNPSGVIRSRPAVGFGWWVRAYGGGYGRILVYAAHLNIGVRLGGKVLLTAEDCAREGVTLSAPYHTKNLFDYAWELDGVRFTARFLQEQEHALAAIVDVQNASGRDVECRVFGVLNYRRRLDVSGGWEEGLTARYDAEQQMLLARAYSEGTLIGLSGSTAPAGHVLGYSDADVHSAMTGEVPLRTEAGPRDSLVATGGAERANALAGALAFDMPLAASNTSRLTLRLLRSETDGGLRELCRAGHGAIETEAAYKLAHDDEFWSRAVRLGGDLPAEWRRGFVYDIETLRINVRQPVGVFRHCWDAMQIQGPRSVLAEAAIDMMLLSYTDPATARDVLLGTFADSPEPWIPCMREDGSCNMVTHSGFPGGTAPEWGAPFWIVEHVYRREPDREWLAALYPRLVAYAEWWRENRRDADGFVFHSCSYESGQDMSWRFGHQLGGGADVSHVRSVDATAALAYSYQVLDHFAAELGRPGEAATWRAHAETLAERTEQLWHGDWYHDFDAKTGAFTHGRDVMHLAPFFYRLAPEAHVKAVAWFIEAACADRRPEWSTFTFMLVEAAYETGLRAPMAELARRLVDYIYTTIDARTQQPLMPLPGVQHEFWPESRTWGAECYGWGTFGLSLVMRTMFGFRERPDAKPGFVLAPSLPKALMKDDRTYVLHNLKAHGRTFNLVFAVVDEPWLEVKATFRGEAPRTLHIADAQTGEVVLQADATTPATFPVENFGTYNVLFDAP